ncbi:MAG: SGNH/GDSL hydrolase family protein [Bacteroidales bacterium]
MKWILKIVGIILITISLMTIYSFTEFEARVGTIILKKAKIKEFLLGIPDYAYGKTISMVDETIKKQKQAAIDTTSQKILLIGDSMLEGLMLRLKDYTAANHHDMKTVIWYSSSTEYFGRCDTLKYFIKQYKPSYIMLVLGANELFVPDIKRKRAGYVKHILKQIDTLNYTWVGPPNWKEDTGINDLIINNVGPMRYFPSKNLNYTRSKDGAHPTHASSAIWMDSIANWIMTKSLKPIVLKKPAVKSKKSPNATILQPLR